MNEAAKEHLLLDSSIRDWVVIPVVLMVFLVGLGRQYIMGKSVSSY